MTLKELSQVYYLRIEIAEDEAKLARLSGEVEETRARLAELRRSVGAKSPRLDGMPRSGRAVSSVELVALAIVSETEILERKTRTLESMSAMIKARRMDCIAEQEKIERYINDIQDSLLRVIFSLRFVECLRWDEVADRIGCRSTAESVKKMCYRFLRRQE